MRPTELLHSRLFRVAILCAIVFATGFGALIAVLYVSYDHFLDRGHREAVTAELHALQTEYAVDRAGSTAAIISLKVRADDSHRWTYAFVDAEGRLLAGTVTQWPAAATGGDGWIQLPGTDGSQVLARWSQTADGARLLVGLDDAELREARRAILGPIVIATIGGALLSLLVGAWVARTAQRPIEHINAAASRIMVSNLSQRLPVTGAGDEFDRVAATMNRLLERIEQAMRSLKGATDDIAHDLRTPLSRLRLRMESLLPITQEPKVREQIEALLADVDAILSTFNALLQVATIESGAMRSTLRRVNLTRIATDAGALYAPTAEEKGQRLVVRLDPEVMVLGHSDLLFASIGNLLDNAIKYAPADTPIELTLAVSAGMAELSVSDRGPGIPVRDRARAMERLVRLDAARTQPGHGMGLSLVRAVCRLHDGDLVLEEHAPGLRAVMRLPCTPPVPVGTGSAA